MSESMNRRNFIAGAGGVAGASLLTAKSYARIIGANERIQIGVVGSGGRGRYLMDSFNRFADQCEFIHVCDVYEPNIAAALKLSRENAKSTMDYKELLANKDLVAVVNATPDHWHAYILLDAVAAGKDVYTEKPFSYSIEQGAKMIKGVRATKQIVQVGMQRRSSEAVRSAKKLVDDGILGEIVMARAQWFRNTKPMPQKLQLQGKLDWERFQGPASIGSSGSAARRFHQRPVQCQSGRDGRERDKHCHPGYHDAWRREFSLAHRKNVLSGVSIK